MLTQLPLPPQYQQRQHNKCKQCAHVWQQIKKLGASAIFYTDNTTLEDETSYLYKVVAYYQAIDCYAAPARSKYNEYEYFLRVYWSVDGVDEETESEILVYPNPVSAMVFVEGVEPAVIHVFNLFGQLVRTAENADCISVEGLAEGLYLLRIMDAEGKVYTNKITIR